MWLVAHMILRLADAKSATVNVKAVRALSIRKDYSAISTSEVNGSFWSSECNVLRTYRTIIFHLQ